MLDDLLAALSDDGSDPFLGLTCDVPFVRKSVVGGLCPVCAARIDRSREAGSQPLAPLFGPGLRLRSAGARAADYCELAEVLIESYEYPLFEICS